MIVDDHDVVRRGLKIFFQAFDDLQLVAEAADGSEAIQLCDELQPDVVLMDLVMPQMDGITATRLIRQSHPATQVIALTSFQDDESVQAMMRAGAVGYLLKNASIDELANTILSAAKASRN
ncbi:MAG: response regulator transcription factor [Anaerolineae bacterium]|nr:response regulator transcription factor [Anaerolineae bacterium]